MGKFQFLKNPYIIFLPLLALLTILTFVCKTDGTYGDETRYIDFATNLTKGYYSPPLPNIDLSNGPGYPLLLAPFMKLKVPLIFLTILNAIFFYLSTVLVYKILIRFCLYKRAIFFSLFYALNLNLYQYIPLIYCETLSVLLITLILFSVINSLDSKQKKVWNKYTFLSGLYIGYLSLTKSIFGYVMVFMLIIVIAFWLINRKDTHFKKSLAIFAIATLTTSPYLLYTYNITGKLFYWNSHGGNNLYWITSPYEGEYGDYIPLALFENNATVGDYEIKDSVIISNHRGDIDEILKLNPLERDIKFKEFAIQNIKSNPVKFVENCFSNMCRILFNFPYSFKYQSPNMFFRIPYNGIIILGSLVCLILTILNWKRIPFSLILLLLFSFVYLGGSLFGSAETRMFLLVVPILIVWIAFVLDKFVDIHLKKVTSMGCNQHVK